MSIPKGYEECMNCDPCNPECDEDGRPYTCFQCCNSGYVRIAPDPNQTEINFEPRETT